MAKDTDLFGKPIVVPIGTDKLKSPTAKRLANALLLFKLEDLKDAWYALTGNAFKAGSKDTLCAMLATLVDFKDQAAFDEFFGTLPPLLREALAKGAYEDYLPTKPFDKMYGKPIVSVKDDYYYQSWSIDKASRLGIFKAVGEAMLTLPAEWRSSFSPWLPKPEGYYLIPSEVPEGTVWTNTEAIQETIPLMIEALAELLKEKDAYETARKGLLKGSIKDARARCGQKPFAIAGSLGLDSIELFARFIAAFESRSPKRPADSALYLKELLRRFLKPLKEELERNHLRGAIFEYTVLIDHLSKKPGSYMTYTSSYPPSREGLRDILLEMGNACGWYTVEGLVRSLQLRGRRIAFCSANTECDELRLKADALTVEGKTYTSKSYEPHFYVDGIMRYSLLVLPLMKAYFYLLAVLGVVEIRETEPAGSMKRNGSSLPISLYDGLEYVRVTEFGQWCLDLRKEKPELAAQVYEAIADDELLIVTFRGESLERRLFLERIGDKLGEERYRVSDSSFVRACTSLEELERRIAAFRKLIDPHPSPRWEAFFSTLKSKAGFLASRVSAVIFTLPGDPSIRKILVSDAKLRSIAFRAEGNRVVVQSRDYKKFAKILAEYGFSDTLD